MPDNNEPVSKTITADATCLYVLKIGQNQYGKFHMLLVFTDGTNRYVWLTTVQNPTSCGFEPNHTYKIKCNVESILSPNEYRVQRVREI